MSLYQKYRPQNFDEIHGQEHVKSIIQAALQKNMASHAYLFTGPRGTGKTTIARLLARALMCENPEKTNGPCQKCDRCREALDGRAMDLIEMDAASHTGVDDVRDLIEKAQFSPSVARKKVYIIDEVHMLSKSAFNALLKTLEEPPPHVHFILATTEIEKVPETILSRCQRFDFHRIKTEDIIKKLEHVCKKEKVKCKKAVLEMIAEQSDGALRNAEVLLEQLISENSLDENSAARTLGIIGHSIIQKFLDLLDQEKWNEAINFISELHASGQNLKTFTREILKKLQKKLLEIASATKMDKEELHYLTNLIDIFGRANEKFRSSLVPELPLEMAVAEIALIGHRFSTDGNQASDDNIKKENNPDKKIAKANKDPEKKESKKDGEKIPGKMPEKIDENFKQLWIEILNSPEFNPALRNSLKTSIPRELQKDKLVLVLRSEFHHEKVRHPDISSLIEKVIGQTFGQPITIEWLLEPQIADDTSQEVSRSFTPPAPLKSTKENATEIFC